MRGLIYKELVIFYKGIDKKLILIAVGAIVLLMLNTGIYGGMFASVMLAMTIGMQNLMSFASDEKAGWEKYQLAMPVGAARAVAGKYVSVICTLAVSFVGSIFFNLLSGIAFRQFDLGVWGVSAAFSVLLPLAWNSINLPVIYWFGYRSSQILRMLVMFPMFYFIKGYEDGSGLSAMTSSVLSNIAVAGGVSILLFLLSMLISVAAYRRRR